MFRKMLAVAIVVLVLPACPIVAQVVHSHWVGGPSGEWGNPNNWDPATVPDNQDPTTFAVIIDANHVSIALLQDRTIDYLEVHGEAVEISKGEHYVSLTLMDARGLANHGELHIGGDGRFDIVGQVTNAQNAKLEFWWVEIIGNLYNYPNAELEFGSHFEIRGGDLENDGNLFIEPTCSEVTVDLDLINAGHIHSYGAPISVWGSCENSGVISGSHVIYSKGIFQHTGTISNKTGDTFHVEVGTPHFNNNGTIEVNPAGALTFNRSLVNEPGGVIKLLGGTLAATSITQSAGATFEGFGTISGDLFIEPGALVKLTGPTNIIGDVNIPEYATLEVGNGQTLITGYTACKGTIRLRAGTVVFAGGRDCIECNIVQAPGPECDCIIALINDAITQKAGTLQKINDACEKEQQAHDALQYMLRSWGSGPWHRRDILMAARRIGGAASLQHNCEGALNKNIELLQEVLTVLGLDPEQAGNGDTRQLSTDAYGTDGLSPAEIVSRLQDARAKKAHAVAMIDASVTRESQIYDAFQQCLKNGDLCDWRTADIVNAKSKIHFARLSDELAKRMLETSVNQLDAALSALPLP